MMNLSTAIDVGAYKDLYEEKKNENTKFLKKEIK
jgi:hypothetical protein